MERRILGKESAKSGNGNGDDRLQELLKGGELFRLLVQSASEFAIFALDSQGRIVTWNWGAERLLGYKEGEILGLPGATIFTPEDRATGVPDREVGSALQGRPAEDERWHLRKDGTRFFASGYMMPVFDEEGIVTGIVKIVHDLTARREAELERTRLLEEATMERRIADEANRVKDQFLATLSHELRTPLTPVLLLLPQFAEDERIPADIRKDLELIRKNIEMEARLIDDLLDIPRIASGKLSINLQKCDAHASLAHAAKICQDSFAQRDVALNLALEASEHTLIADPVRLEQIFWNLITNAFKFTSDGGKITVRSYNPRPGQLHIEVRDTGIGIEAQLLSELFSPFEQGGDDVTRRFGGLGLGLTIAKAMVELQHGTLTAKSDGKGKGAAFTVSLPTARD